MAASNDTIKVAIDASRKLIIQARGKPAEIVAYGAAAAVVFVAVAGGYGAYQLGKATYSGVRGLLQKRKEEQEDDDEST